MTMNLTSILPASRIRDRLIDRIAYANDASYFPVFVNANQDLGDFLNLRGLII